jgi:hypothetical protein
VAYVGYRISLSMRIVAAKRRGDAERELALRRRAFWSFRGTVLVAMLVVLLLLALAAINSR